MAISNDKVEEFYWDVHQIFREMEEMVGVARGIGPTEFFQMDEHTGDNLINMDQAGRSLKLGAEAYERLYYVLRDFAIELSK